MNVQFVEQAAEAGHLDYVDRQLTQIARLGVGFVRSSFAWPRLEPAAPVDGQHTYDFSVFDDWVGALARHHLRWMPTVKGVPIPVWAASPSATAECGTGSPPAGSGDYAALMRALARRYGRGGSFWSSHPQLPAEPITDYEVWNEPNFGRLWCPGPEPAKYARLYLAARAAVHSVDPRARVLVGGLASFRTDETGPPVKMSPPTFLSRAVRSVPRFADRIDVVAVHPYGADPEAVLGVLRWLRVTLDSVGLRDTPMLANELGWHTKGELGLAPVPEVQRAEYFSVLTPAMAQSQCGVIGIAAHTWVTPEQRLSLPEDWYGMADPLTGEPYPTAAAYGDQVRALERGRPPATTPACASLAGSGGGS
jgi:hypothetical protein